MSFSRIKFDYEMNDFEKNAQKVIEEVKTEQDAAVKYCANVFANSASKHTPPNIGKASIKKELYFRPFLVLIRLVRGGYAGIAPTNEDISQLKSGMVYKVLNTKGFTRRDNIAFGYCKTKSQLKKMQKIETRGLAKVMWGKNLERIGVKVPTGIQRLLRKSPKLQTLDYNKVKFTHNDSVSSVDIENEAENIGKFGHSAKIKGYASVKTGIKFFLKKISDMKREL